MPDEPDDNSESLERASKNRGLSRRSPGLARHLRALQPRVDALRRTEECRENMMTDTVDGTFTIAWYAN